MDFSPAKEVIAVVLGTLGATTGVAVLAWKQISRQRLHSSTDTDERKRLQDAFESSQKARERAHKLTNEMMTMQYRLGKLETENEWCNRRTTDLAIQVDALKKENKVQAEQISLLIRRNNITDFGS